MKWIVGLDLRSFSDGAARLAPWLGPPSGPKPEGIHVIETRYLEGSVTDKLLAQVTDDLVPVVERCLEQIDVRGAFGPLAVVPARSGDVGLGREVKTRGAVGVVVGRRAEMFQDRAILRLGRVARRLLRALPGAVVVVPADWAPPDDAARRGPVVLATDLELDCEGAVRFARQVAEEHDRELVVLHTMPFVEEPYVSTVRDALAGSQWLESEATRRGRLLAWQKHHDLEGARVLLERGDIVPRAVAVADEEGAAMLVVGSRRLSKTDRLFTSSVGSTLAGAAHCPVAVVPPEFPEQLPG